MENKTMKMYWNQPIMTDTRTRSNKPDIIVIKKEEKQAYNIYYRYISVPLEENLHEAYR